MNVNVRPILAMALVALIGFGAAAMVKGILVLCQAETIGKPAPALSEEGPADDLLDEPLWPPPSAGFSLAPHATQPAGDHQPFPAEQVRQMSGTASAVGEEARPGGSAVYSADYSVGSRHPSPTERNPSQDRRAGSVSDWSVAIPSVAHAPVAHAPVAHAPVDNAPGSPGSANPAIVNGADRARSAPAPLPPGVSHRLEERSRSPAEQKSRVVHADFVGSLGHDVRHTRYEAMVAPAASLAGEQPLPPLAPQFSGFLGSFHERIAGVEDRERVESVNETLHELPADFQPWWNLQIERPVRRSAQPVWVDVELLVFGALEHAPQVHAINDIAPIYQTQIVEAEAEFDWRTFLKTTFDHTSDPVGNTLTTGGAPRFRDRLSTNTAGLRKLTRQGGQIELSQTLGYQDNNSLFFVPNQQASATLLLSFTQPLLNGAGEAYNTSRIVLAAIDANIAHDELSKQLQDHLLQVMRAYWELYRARAVLLQKRRLFERGHELLETLEARRDVDALHNQLVKARAAATTRYAEIVRAEASIRNAETNLRILVNDPQLQADGRLELLPHEVPLSARLEISQRGSLYTAIQNRPEIAQSIMAVQAAGIRLGMSEKELLPKLDLVMSTYVAGLAGSSDLGRGYSNQFDEGEPGYSVGLLFEVPLGNRAAKARYERRCLEVRRAMNQFRATVEAGMAECEVAVREIETSYQEMLAKYRSMRATEAEVDYLKERWRKLPGSDRAASFLLEDLLESQERLANEEHGFVSAQVNYTFSLANLKRATGTLLQCTQVSPPPISTPHPELQPLFPEEGPVDGGPNLPPAPLPEEPRYREVSQE